MSPAQYNLNSAESWPKTPIIHSYYFTHRYIITITGAFKKEDLAAAVVLNTIANMVHIILLECQNSGIDNVYLCGAMIDHPYARRCLMRAALEAQLLEFRPARRVTVKMARYGTYIGVVGAWLLGMDGQRQKQNKTIDEKGESKNGESKNGELKNC